MEKKVIFTKEGRDDLEDIFFDIDKFSSKYAIEWSDKVFEKIELLAKFPYMGRFVPEIRIESIREIFVGQYRVIYEVRQDKIEIIAIKSGRKSLSEK